MTIAKVTWIYRAPSRSWTESLYIDTATIQQGGGEINLDVVLDYATRPTGIMGKRRLLLGSDCGIIACRAGYPSDDPNTAVRAKLRYVDQTGNQQHGADDTEISLVTRCGNLPNTRLKYISLRGLWANVAVGAEGFVGPVAGAMQATFGNYATALITEGWGWMGTSTKSEARVDQITPEAGDDRQVIDLQTPLTNVVVGSNTVVRVRGVNVKSRLNAQLVVEVIAANKLRTVYPYATFPYTGGGFVTHNALQFWDIANVTPQRIGSRDVGNSWRPVVGRRRATPRG